jgi:uncharacterized repeat protein (TIGR03943 family)
MSMGSSLVRGAVPHDQGHDEGRHDEGRHGHDGGHGHTDHGPRVAWLLVVPVVAVVLIAPNPLGSFTAARQSTASPVAAPANDDAFPPLPDTGEEVALPVLDFVTRALFDDRRSLDGVTVKLVGMVSPPAKGGSEDFRLTRFMIACCAADGQAIQVAVHGTTGPLPPTDSWVEVVGHWRAPPTGTTPEDEEAPPLDLVRMRAVPQPENPYE